MSAYPALLSPARIGTLQLKNRIMMAPMGSNFAEQDGSCGERIQAYYEARAKGGAGLLVMGVVSVAFPAGTAEPYQVGLSDDRFIPGMAEIARRVHRHGGKIAVQLQHAGKTAIRDLVDGRELWVPAMPRQQNSDMMAALTPAEKAGFISNQIKSAPKIRVMDHADIAQMIEWFAAAALRAKQAGFDGVEIHAGHTYIIAGFLSSYTNSRDDDYGGSLPKRARLMCEVIRAVKARCGADFPVWVRLDGEEIDFDGGISPEDAVAAARLAEEAGADAVHVSAYASTRKGANFTIAPLMQSPAALLPLAGKIKAAINIPVIAVGRLEPDAANSAIEAGLCDFVAMGRKLLADPDLPIKLIENRAEAIRPCIYCYACVSQIFINERVKCAVNPQTGHEYQLSGALAKQARHIVVIGGGPAGLEAARSAALRGHRVTLLEKAKRLGGTLFFAALAYPENGKLLDYLLHEVRSLPIDIRLEFEATAKTVAALQPDTVIVASGARRAAPALAGVDQPHVFSGDELRALLTGDGAEEVAKRKLSLPQRVMMKAGNLSGVTDSSAALQKLSHLWMPLGEHVAIIGGGLVGLELAEFLLARKRKVTVLEEKDYFGQELSIVRRWRVLHELNEHNATLIAGATVSLIDGHTLIYHTAQGEARLKADSVVLATGAQTDNTLALELEQSGLDVRLAGDAAALGFIEGALRAGHAAAMAV
ncbi:FAD-dependent oxidoreductase [Craterilacuibacter sp. RT1T]|uniref:FAD-dependent oxidoreductase n=1 Tax=Craterilacuibacter sp. RT1T TaxID=2942211 RepID=UPI0020BEF48B|nr:FAD-dependent oxidoreductase [Craterilacuibacter sp. RT1T]MCL6263252.1 FAD-dependent oxidoreductase [Craterilacuibacter sp. RT1T]